jgi:tetratricopeptide (TPR) repeat protein
MSRRVFISSTSLDLKKYRQAAIDVCEQLGFEAIAMENFEAMGVGATEGSKRKLRDADVYVGIIAHRYGYIEAGQEKSVTEIEFEYAGERGLNRLCFLIDPDYAWPKAYIQKSHQDKLNAFKERIDSSVIRSLYTTVDDFRDKLLRALVEWQEWRTARGGELEAIHATMPEDVPDQAQVLVGRDDLIEKVSALLDKGKRVLLQGFGGTGKTALAAAIAARRVKPGSSVLWLRAGSAERDDILTAFTRPFHAEHDLLKETSLTARARAIRLLMSDHHVKLLVLDDVWDGRALASLLSLNAVPQGVPILVTSRLRFPGLTRLDVGNLQRQDSLKLLEHLTDRDLRHDPAADALCAQFSDHAFAVRLAGITMSLDDLSARELLDRVAHAPYTLAAPDGEGSVEDLISSSLFQLEADAREVFMAFGCFFTASATPELLAIYMRRDEVEVEDALNRLQRRGLAERVAETDDRALEYRIHDLAYSYARSRADDAARHQAFNACLAYLERYKDPTHDHFAPLRSELDNFNGAVNWAMGVKRYAEVEQFANWLYRGFDTNTTDGFLQLQGYARQATNLLQQAAAAAEALGEWGHQAAYLGNLGSAYRDLGQVTVGMKHYRRALKLYRELGDTAGEGVTLGRIGISYRLLGQAGPAIEHLEQALAVARQFSDQKAEGINLANLGIAYRQLNRLDEAVTYLERALAISRARQDLRGESINLGNLGDCYRDRGDLEQAAAAYKRAHALSEDLGDRRGSGINLGRLGDLYRSQGQFDLARQHLGQALAVAQATGDRRGESINLGRLGDTCRDQGDVPQAIQHHEQALGITRQMDDKRGEGYSLADLGEDYLALGNTVKAIEYLQAAKLIFEALGMTSRLAPLEARLSAIESGKQG